MTPSEMKAREQVAVKFSEALAALEAAEAAQRKADEAKKSDALRLNAEDAWREWDDRNHALMRAKAAAWDVLERQAAARRAYGTERAYGTD